MANTVIGNGIVVDGEITGAEALVVRGTVKGKVGVQANVYIENSAKVEADIDAHSVEVAGNVTGNVTATTRVEIKADGKMIGDMRSPRILIADGALFKGSIDMDQGR